MRTLRRLGLVGIVGGVVVGCSSDSTGTTLNIVGTWHGTKFEVTSVANPATKVELVSQGLTITVVFNANLTYVTTLTAPGQAPEVSSGTYVLTASSLTLTATGSPPEVTTFAVTLSGNTLTATGGAINFDFGSGTDEPGKLEVILVRQ